MHDKSGHRAECERNEDLITHEPREQRSGYRFADVSFLFLSPTPLHLKFAIEACAMFVAMTSMISRFSFVCFQ